MPEETHQVPDQKESAIHTMHEHDEDVKFSNNSKHFDNLEKRKSKADVFLEEMDDALQ